MRTKQALATESILHTSMTPILPLASLTRCGVSRQAVLKAINGTLQHKVCSALDRNTRLLSNVVENLLLCGSKDVVHQLCKAAEGME